MTDAKPATPLADCGGASRTLGEAAESSRDSDHGKAEGASKRPPGRKDPQTTGQNAPDDHNVPTR